MKTTIVSKKIYDREFKMDAARLVVDVGRTVAAVAADIGVSPTTVRAWISIYKKGLPGASVAKGQLSPVELQLKQANDEIRKLRMQVDFLKKTMAYFVEQPQ